MKSRLRAAVGIFAIVVLGSVSCRTVGTAGGSAGRAAGDAAEAAGDAAGTAARGAGDIIKDTAHEADREMR